MAEDETSRAFHNSRLTTSETPNMKSLQGYLLLAAPHQLDPNSERRVTELTPPQVQRNAIDEATPNAGPQFCQGRKAIGPGRAGLANSAVLGPVSLSRPWAGCWAWPRLNALGRRGQLGNSGHHVGHHVLMVVVAQEGRKRLRRFGP
jgi:hypothetical protein